MVKKDIEGENWIHSVARMSALVDLADLFNLRSALKASSGATLSSGSGKTHISNLHGWSVYRIQFQGCYPAGKDLEGPARAKVQDFLLVGVRYADSKGGCARDKAFVYMGRSSAPARACSGTPRYVDYFSWQFKQKLAFKALPTFLGPSLIVYTVLSASFASELQKKHYACEWSAPSLCRFGTWLMAGFWLLLRSMSGGRSLAMTMQESPKENRTNSLCDLQYVERE